MDLTSEKLQKLLGSPCQYMDLRPFSRRRLYTVLTVIHQSLNLSNQSLVFQDSTLDSHLGNVQKAYNNKTWLLLSLQRAQKNQLKLDPFTSLVTFVSLMYQDIPTLIASHENKGAACLGRFTNKTGLAWVKSPGQFTRFHKASKVHPVSHNVGHPVVSTAHGQWLIWSPKSNRKSPKMMEQQLFGRILENSSKDW